MSTRALLSCLLFIRAYWLMLTRELQLIDVLHKIISQAGRMGGMAPLDSIQSTSHLFWYNYLRSPRLLAVMARGMLLYACSSLHRKRNQHIDAVLSSINCYWNNLGMNKNLRMSLKRHVSGSMHIFYISTQSLYPKRFQTNMFVRCGVFQKGVHSTSNIIFDMYFPFCILYFSDVIWRAKSMKITSA